MKTIKFYSPLNVKCEPDSALGENYGGDFISMHEYVEIPSSVAVYYKDEILAAIRKREPASGRGLMEYLHGDQTVDRKVYSAYPTVEEYQGELWGVMEVGLRGRLTDAETKILTEYITGQYADGFGEFLEQHPVHTEDGDIYVSFWDSEYFVIQTESKLKNLSAPVSERPKEFSITLTAAETGDYLGEGHLDLPAELPEILDAMDQARVRGGKEYKVAVRYVYRKYLQNLIPDEPSLDELNHLAERLSQLNEHESVCFGGVVNMEKKPSDLARLINLTHNLEDCQVADARNDYQLGKFYAENGFIESLDKVSDEVFELIDFEKVGRTARELENGVFLENCYVVQPVAERSWKSPYTGNAPREYAEPPYIFRLYVTAEGNDAEGMWLELPATEDALEQTARKVDAASINYCTFSRCVSEIPQLNAVLCGYEEIGELNQLASRLSEIRANGDLPKFKAALHVADCSELHDCACLADNLNTFALHSDAVTLADYGEKVFSDLHGLKRGDEGMKHFNYSAFGAECMKWTGAELTPYGVIQPLGSQQEQLQGQEMEAAEQDADMEQEIGHKYPQISM